jgi:hypothetical protein
MKSRAENWIVDPAAHAQKSSSRTVTLFRVTQLIEIITEITRYHYGRRVYAASPPER